MHNEFTSDCTSLTCRKLIFVIFLLFLAKLRKLGCYNDSSEKRAMPVLIANFRQSDIDWNDLRSSVITNCKEVTKERVIRLLCQSDRHS